MYRTQQSNLINPQDIIIVSPIYSHPLIVEWYLGASRQVRLRNGRNACIAKDVICDDSPRYDEEGNALWDSVAWGHCNTVMIEDSVEGSDGIVVVGTCQLALFPTHQECKLIEEANGK